MWTWHHVWVGCCRQMLEGRVIVDVLGELFRECWRWSKKSVRQSIVLVSFVRSRVSKAHHIASLVFLCELARCGGERQGTSTVLEFSGCSLAVEKIWAHRSQQRIGIGNMRRGFDVSQAAPRTSSRKRERPDAVVGPDESKHTAGVASSIAGSCLD